MVAGWPYMVGLLKKVIFSFFLLLHLLLSLFLQFIGIMNQHNKLLLPVQHEKNFFNKTDQTHTHKLMNERLFRSLSHSFRSCFVCVYALQMHASHFTYTHVFDIEPKNTVIRPENYKTIKFSAFSPLVENSNATTHFQQYSFHICTLYTPFIPWTTTIANIMHFTYTE